MRDDISPSYRQKHDVAFARWEWQSKAHPKKRQMTRFQRERCPFLAPRTFDSILTRSPIIEMTRPPLTVWEVLAEFFHFEWPVPNGGVHYRDGVAIIEDRLDASNLNGYTIPTISISI